MQIHVLILDLHGQKRLKAVVVPQFESKFRQCIAMLVGARFIAPDTAPADMQPSGYLQTAVFRAR